jgi:hypothetical protein
MVDWYYIFSILPLGVYPCSPDIYNVVEFFHLFFLSETSSPSPFNCSGVLSSSQSFPRQRRPFAWGRDVAPTQPLNGSTLSHGGSTHILPTDPAPILKYRLQLVQVLRFQRIFLGSFQIFERCNRWHGLPQNIAERPPAV